MPLSSIVVVVLRLFAIQTLVKSVNFAASVAASVSKGVYQSGDFWVYLVPVALAALGLIEWWLAPLIARLVTRRHNSEVAFGSLSRLDLYSFAFVFLGLYFILTSVAPSLNWLHYSLIVSAVGSSAEQQSSYYNLASNLLTLIAGVFTLLLARRWARRMLEMELRDESRLQAPARADF